MTTLDLNETIRATAKQGGMLDGKNGTRAPQCGKSIDACLILAAQWMITFTPVKNYLAPRIASLNT